MVKKIIAHAKESRQTFRELKPAAPYCEAIDEEAYVDAQLDVYPCPLMARPELRIGNLRESGGLDNLWATPRFKKVQAVKREKWRAPQEKCVFWCPAYFCGKDRTEYPFAGIEA